MIVKFLLLYLLFGTLFVGIVYTWYKVKTNNDMISTIKEHAAKKEDSINAWSDNMVVIFVYVYYLLCWPFILYKIFKK